MQGLQDPATAISRRAARVEGIEALLERIRALPELERKLVTHCGLEGMSYDEVARRLLEPLNLKGVVPSTSRHRAPAIRDPSAGLNMLANRRDVS